MACRKPVISGNVKEVDLAEDQGSSVVYGNVVHERLSWVVCYLISILGILAPAGKDMEAK
jgi:hypothetical protein